MYQNEDGKWVTDLAYYSSFEKETHIPDELANQLQSEEFVGGGKWVDECFKYCLLLPHSEMFTCRSGQAMEKIIEDQEEFEKEHQFMQVRIAPFWNLCGFYDFKLSTDACKDFLPLIGGTD